MYRHRALTVRVVLLVALFFAFHSLGWLNPIEQSSRFIISSSARLVYNGARSFRGWFSSVFSTSPRAPSAATTSREAVSSLSGNALAALETELRLAREANEELRALLNFSTSSSYSLVGADVIGRTLDPLGTTVVINQGRRQGVFEGNPVVVGNGLLIGTVLRADEKVALVRLINDSRSRVAATVLGAKKSQGLVEGGYGLSVKMNFIPQDALIKPGDPIVTSGLEDTAPRGLYIGTVEVVEKKSQEPFQQAVLKPAVDLGNLSVVAVLIYRPNL